MEAITFRTANIEDVPAITKLVNAVFRPAPGNEGWTSEANLVSGQRTTPEMITSQLQQASSVFILGLMEERDEPIVACIHLDGRTKNAYMGTLAVDTQLQNSGISRALKDYAEEYASRVYGAEYFVTLILQPRIELIASSIRRGYLPTGRLLPYPRNAGLGTPLKENLMLMELHKRSPYTPRQNLNILFSRRPDWENNITTSLENTSHRFTFEDFNDDNIKHYDLLIPLTIQSMKYLSERRHLIPDNPIPIPALNTVQLCDDKFLLNQILIAKGFGKFIPRMQKPLAYPYILKKRIDEWGMNSHIIANTEDELRFSRQMADPDYFQQIFIPGADQYATHILFMDNKIMRSLSVGYTFGTQTPIQGKSRPQGSKTFSSPYLSLFAAMLSSIGFEGLCCIDYKVLDNRPFILEINPRLGASLCPYFHPFIDEVA